jgi:hypothetical protein
MRALVPRLTGKNAAGWNDRITQAEGRSLYHQQRNDQAVELSQDIVGQCTPLSFLHESSGKLGAEEALTIVFEMGNRLSRVRNPGAAAPYYALAEDAFRDRDDIGLFWRTRFYHLFSELECDPRNAAAARRVVPQMVDLWQNRAKPSSPRLLWEIQCLLTLFAAKLAAKIDIDEDADILERSLNGTGYTQAAVRLRNVIQHYAPWGLKETLLRRAKTVHARLCVDDCRHSFDAQGICQVLSATPATA